MLQFQKQWKNQRSKHPLHQKISPYHHYHDESRAFNLGGCLPTPASLRRYLLQPASSQTYFDENSSNDTQHPRLIYHSHRNTLYTPITNTYFQHGSTIFFFEAYILRRRTGIPKLYLKNSFSVSVLLTFSTRAGSMHAVSARRFGFR